MIWRGIMQNINSWKVKKKLPPQTDDGQKSWKITNTPSFYPLVLVLRWTATPVPGRTSFICLRLLDRISWVSWQDSYGSCSAQLLSAARAPWALLPSRSIRKDVVRLEESRALGLASRSPELSAALEAQSSKAKTGLCGTTNSCSE